MSINLHQIIRDSVELLRFRSEPKKIALVLELGAFPHLDADAERIKRVFLNILMNAIKFSPRNSSIVSYPRRRYRDGFRNDIPDF